jgi:hypothetical protein
MFSVKVQNKPLRKSSDYPRPESVVTTGSSLNPLDRKIDLVTEGLEPCYKKMLKDRLLKNNANTVCDYIISSKRENYAVTYTVIDICIFKHKRTATSR